MEQQTFSFTLHAIPHTPGSSDADKRCTSPVKTKSSRTISTGSDDADESFRRKLQSEADCVDVGSLKIEAESTFTRRHWLSLYVTRERMSSAQPTLAAPSSPNEMGTPTSRLLLLPFPSSMMPTLPGASTSVKTLDTLSLFKFDPPRSSQHDKLFQPSEVTLCTSGVPSQNPFLLLTFRSPADAHAFAASVMEYGSTEATDKNRIGECRG